MWHPLLSLLPTVGLPIIPANIIDTSLFSSKSRYLSANLCQIRLIDSAQTQISTSSHVERSFYLILLHTDHSDRSRAARKRDQLHLITKTDIVGKMYSLATPSILYQPVALEACEIASAKKWLRRLHTSFPKLRKLSR